MSEEQKATCSQYFKIGDNVRISPAFLLAYRWSEQHPHLTQMVFVVAEVEQKIGWLMETSTFPGYTSGPTFSSLNYTDQTYQYQMIKVLPQTSDLQCFIPEPLENWVVDCVFEPSP